MGFTDSFKKIIGLEEMSDDDIVTEKELEESKRKLSREADRETRFTPPLSSRETEKSRSSSYGVSFGSSSTSSRASEKKFQVTGTGSLKLILIEPKSYDDCPKLVDSLKARKPVIINLERLETETARKIFDFLSGATYALNGDVKRIANNIYIFTPDNVNVQAEQGHAPAQASEKNPWR